MGRDLNEVLYDIGLGPYQWLQMVLLSGIILTQGAQILIASSILAALQETWHVTPMLKGIMMSIIFIGMFVGGLVGGSLGDVCGRRPTILSCFAGLVVFGGMIALAQGPVSMIIIRFFFGVAFGSGVAPTVTMIVESCPFHLRAHALNFGSLPFILGQIYASVLLIIFMPNLSDPSGTQWPLVQLLSVAPGALFFFVSCFFMRESPHFLIAQGKQVEAILAVQHIARTNKQADKVEGLDAKNPARQLELPDAGEATALMNADNSRGTSASAAAVAAEHNEVASSTGKQEKMPKGVWDKLSESIVVLSSKQYRGIVIGGAYLTFLGNFLFYGLCYALPQVFKEIHNSLLPAHQVLLISLCDIPSILLVFFCIYAKSIGHRDGMLILAGCSAMLSLTLIGIEYGKSERMYLGLPSAYMIKYSAAAFFNLSYIYIGEVFPASVRVSGVAVCVSAGRAGSIAAPLVVEALYNETFELLYHKVPNAPFLVLTSGLCLLAIVVIKIFLYFELKNAPLQNIAHTALKAQAQKLNQSERGLPADSENARAAG